MSSAVTVAGQSRDGSLRRRPQRTCIACGAKTDKSSLTRLVSSGSGIRVDPTGKMNGRGAYLCLGPDCDPASLRARKLSYALRTTVTEEETEILLAGLLGSADGESQQSEANDQHD